MNTMRDAIEEQVNTNSLERYHNEYEAYSIILEMFDKLKDQSYYLEESVDTFWNKTKNHMDTHHTAENIAELAIDVACKAIEIAKAARKATFSYYETLTD